MTVNLNKPHLWKADIAQSVDMYNDWFMGLGCFVLAFKRIPQSLQILGK
jgi:hypothetical protein